MMLELGGGGIAAVGRGGVRAHHRCSPNLLRCPAVPSIWNFFSRKGYSGRKEDAAAAEARKGNLQHLASVRCHGYWKEKGCFLKQTPFEVSQICSRAFSSCGPQETNVDGLVAGKDKLLIDCGPDQECVLGGIVALGKFDALHVGHRELAIQAAKAGTPFLLSFVGMAEVLGWEYRAPIVAHSDRTRVLSTWAPYCDDVTPHEYQVEFSTVRHLSPQQFVERLAKDLRVSGVVAGENYRFGYRASGDVSDLVRLCKEYGLEAYIVSPVFDESPHRQNGTSTFVCKREYVSSTRVRHALSVGDMESVTRLLGRRHRLVLLKNQECIISETMLKFPASCILNQPPKEGVYEQCILLVGDRPLRSCKVIVNSEHIHVKFNPECNPLVNRILDQPPISIEFC